jgi:hypothetical protein
MKTWTVALVATLGLCSAETRADEPAKEPAGPATPEVLPAPEDHPAIIAPTAPPQRHDSEAPCRSRGQAGRIWAWLTFCPNLTGCDICYTKTRPTPLYAYFICYPCYEGCGAACSAGCASCAAGCARH